MSNCVFRNNNLTSNDYQNIEDISKEIDIKLHSEIIPGGIYLSDYEGKASDVIFEYNRYENPVFENNHEISRWIPGGEWDAMEIIER